MDTVVFLINAAAVENGTEHTLISCMWADIATAHQAEGILQGTWQHALAHMLKILRKTAAARVQQTEVQTTFSGIIFFSLNTDTAFLPRDKITVVRGDVFFKHEPLLRHRRTNRHSDPYTLSLLTPLSLL